jgi:hypothetical protein
MKNRYFSIITISAILFITGCTNSSTQKPLPSLQNNNQTQSTIPTKIDSPATSETSDNWTVESGNTEANYDTTGTPYVNIFMVALEDNGKSGRLIGCGDSLVGVQVKYGLSRDENTAKATLEKLFAVKQQNYGESGLYNALYQSDLKVESLTVNANKKATLNLSGKFMIGGVCDNPRFEEQIKETVLQFKNLYSDVEIFINDKPLKELLSGQG